VISAPPVPPPLLRGGYHVHDGFYLRLGAGIGAGHLNVSSHSDAANDFSIGGAGLALNLWVGGTPWRGVALGGMLHIQGISDSNVEVAGANSHETMNGGVGYLAPFIDAFPDPLRGLHVGGSLGLAGFNARADGNALEQAHRVKDYESTGFGGSAWVGYMGWVGPEWSMGGMLQLTVMRVRQDEDDVERVGSGYTLALTFSALYH
jgi:hypothetical protein